MDDLNILLSMIENPTRRRILEALVREPHYPLQLSRQLGLSQQGIMKHLKALEDSHLVRCYSEDSDQGGPARKIYVPTTGFTVTVDIGPGLFNTQIITRELEIGPDGGEARALSDEDWKEYREKIGQVRMSISEIDEELAQLALRRAELIHAKEVALNDACGTVESMVDDYHVRRILYEYIQHPELRPNEIARALGMRDDDVTEIIEEFLRGI
jgi:ArsR family transcriptional regulator